MEVLAIYKDGKRGILEGKDLSEIYEQTGWNLISLTVLPPRSEVHSIVRVVTSVIKALQEIGWDINITKPV